MELLKEVKAITGSIPAAEIFKRTLKEFVSEMKKQPKETKVSRELESGHKPHSHNPNKKPARYVPKAIRYKVRNRD